MKPEKGNPSAVQGDHPDASVQRLLDLLEPVETESIARMSSGGRILAEEVRADRDSPALDVSAMDGFAVRLADLQQNALPISGEALIGEEPKKLAPGTALRIYTGSCVPLGADVIVPVELATTTNNQFRPTAGAGRLTRGQHIRCRAENLLAHAIALHPGRRITPAAASTLATFGATHVRVYRPVRVSSIITGNELQSADITPTPWQIRDSNGPLLRHMFNNVPWIESQSLLRIRDDRTELVRQLRRALDHADVIFVTGGASVGEHDHLHLALADLDARFLFSRLPIRPGKPMTAAFSAEGKVIIGLPGNPVAATVCVRRFGAAVLRKVAGYKLSEPTLTVSVNHHGEETLHLWWFRPVRHNGRDNFEVVPSQGSGDTVAAGRSDGFIEVPPQENTGGQRRFFTWEIS